MIVIVVIVTILIIIQVMIQMAGIMVAVVYQLIMLNKIVPVTAASPEHCHNYNAMRNVQIIFGMMPKSLPTTILMTRIMKIAPFPFPFPPLLLDKHVVQPIFLYPRHKKILPVLNRRRQSQSVGRRMMVIAMAEMTSTFNPCLSDSSAIKRLLKSHYYNATATHPVTGSDYYLHREFYDDAIDLMVQLDERTICLVLDLLKCPMKNSKHSVWGKSTFQSRQDMEKNRYLVQNLIFLHVLGVMLIMVTTAISLDTMPVNYAYYRRALVTVRIGQLMMLRQGCPPLLNLSYSAFTSKFRVSISTSAVPTTPQRRPWRTSIASNHHTLLWLSLLPICVL